MPGCIDCHEQMERYKGKDGIFRKRVKAYIY
jgi:hypothetical protein